MFSANRCEESQLSALKYNNCQSTMNFKEQAMVFIIISPAIWLVFFISVNPEYKLAMVSKDTSYNNTTLTPPILSTGPDLKDNLGLFCILREHFI